jgi:predicted permease
MLLRETIVALRRLRAEPGVSLLAAFSLALGISITSATVAATSSIVWRPLDVRHPGRVSVLVASVSAGQYTWRGGVISAPDFEELVRSQTSFSPLAASAMHTEVMSTADLPTVAQIEAVSAGYFETVGAVPALGRLLTSNDSAKGGRAAVVLGERFWSVRFGKNPGVLGSVVRIAGFPFEVIGVASGSYGGVGSRLMMSTDAWIPLPAADRLLKPQPRDPDEASLTVLGLLVPGRSIAEANVELDTIAKRLDAARSLYRVLPNGGRVTLSRSWSGRTAADVNAELIDTSVPLRWSLILLACLVLIIACTNLANLMLARGAARRQEFALRRALGGSRSRIMAGQLIESGLMIVAGGLGAFGLTGVLLSLLTIDVPIGGNVVIHVEPHLSRAVFASTVVAMAGCLVVFGWWPAFRSTRTDLRTSLMSEAHAITPRWRTRRGLIAAQVAVTAALFVLAILGARALNEQAEHDSGVDVERLAIGFVDFGRLPWNDSRARQVIDAILLETRQD